MIAAPTAANDTGWTDTATTKDFDVLSDDTYDASRTASITTAPPFGSATVVNGQIRYEPNGTSGTTLTYRISDDVGQYDEATLTIATVHVFAANDDGTSGSPIDAPAAGKSIDVLANDTGSTLSLGSVSVPAHGTATISSGKIQYTPTSGYNGDDSFTYTITDSYNQTAAATVYVNTIARPVGETPASSAVPQTAVDAGLAVPLQGTQQAVPTTWDETGEQIDEHCQSGCGRIDFAQQL